MIWCEVKLGEEVRAEDALTNISNSEIESEFSLANGERFLHATIAINLCAVCGTKSKAVWAATTLCVCGRNNGQESSTVHEPFVALILVDYVK